MSEHDIKSIDDEYDLIALVGSFICNANISSDAKDAIKTIAKECFVIGYSLGFKQAGE